MIRKKNYISMVSDAMKKASFPKLSMNDLRKYKNLEKDIQLSKYSGIDVQRPEYPGNISDVVEVMMDQQAVTRALDDKPVLATFGLGPCVSLVGYEPNHQVGFLTHYSALTEVVDSFSDLLDALYRLGLTDSAPTKFDVRLIGGYDKEDVLIKELKRRVTSGTLFDMTIVEEDIGQVQHGKSVALDTRTGKLFSYNPKHNPNRKHLDELDLLRLLIPRKADLVYQPK